MGKILLICLFLFCKQFLGTLGWLNVPAGGVLLNSVGTGIIMGDYATGLKMGGMYELMNIGLNPLGGAAVPNYNLGSVVGTYFAITATEEIGTAMGIVVATLATTLRQFAAFPNLIIKGIVEKNLKAHNWKGAMAALIATWFPPTIIEQIIPVIVVCGLGEAAAQALIHAIPAWLTKGFQVAGNVLPGLGFAIVLRSLNVEKNIEYLLIGFVLFAYMKVNTVGAALIGLAIALIKYKEAQRLSTLEASGVTGGALGDE